MPPEPIPSVKRPPLCALTVPALIANAIGVRYAIGHTPIPVPSPPSTASALARQRSAHS